MRHVLASSIAILIMICLAEDRASAVVTQESVTPASVKEKGSKFSVEAEKGEDGLIHFTITCRLTAPRYLVAHFELWDGGTILAKSDTPGFVREDSATYHVAVAPKQLAASKFELSENAFGDSGGQPVARPGGTIYRVSLHEFAAQLRPGDAN